GAKGRPITVSTYRLDRTRIKLRSGEGQGQPVVVAAVTGVVQESVYQGDPARLVRRGKPVPYAGTFQLDQGGRGYELISFTGAKVAAPTVSTASRRVASSFNGVHLQDVAGKVGLDFQQGSFRFGMSND